MEDCEEKIKPIFDKFIKEHNPMNFCNACGIGIGALTEETSEILGISLYFENKSKMESFPYKETTYNGIPVYKRVTGKIRAL